MIASGMGYKARDEKTPEEFNSIRCCKIRNFEMSLSPVEAVSSWNMRVQYWLKYYVLVRMMDRSKPRGQL